jgi:hypothetical protein
MSNIEDELLIQELEESVKQDRLNKLWDDYGPYLIAVAVIIVLITAFVSVWGNYEQRSNSRNTEIILSTLGKEDAAKTLAEASEGFKSDQKFIALFASAGMLVEKKQYDEAIEHYKKIYSDKSVSKVLRDLALYIAVKTEWSYGEKKSDGGVYLGHLKPLIIDEKNPWHYHASIQAAIISAHDLDDYGKARQFLLSVINKEGTIPTSLSDRAKALDHVYSLKQKNVTIEPLNEQSSEDVPEEQEG